MKPHPCVVRAVLVNKPYLFLFALLIVRLLRASSTPAGVPVIPADALAPARMAATHLPGAALAVVAVTGQPFAQALRVQTQRPTPNPWDLQLTFTNTTAMREGDVLVLSASARCIADGAQPGTAQLEFVFEHKGAPWTKSITLAVDVGPAWQQVYVPFTAVEPYAPGAAHLCVRFGSQTQTLELAAISLRNCGATNLHALPRSTAGYAGVEPDAPWRADAAARIDTLRNATLQLRVLDADGQPLSGAVVQVRMQRHAFGFGAAVAARYFTTQAATPDAQRYRTMVTQLFNRVVLENELKWPLWIGQCTWARDMNSNTAMATVDWLRAHDIAVRGHCLVWPGWDNVPDSLCALSNAPARLSQAVLAHIADEAGALRGRLCDWDVINEPYSNRDLMNVLGNAAMVDWFRAAHAADPRAKLYINDYSILAAGGRDTAHQNHYYTTIAWLLAHGAPLSGIGMQGHFGWDLTPPTRLLEILDRFAALGREIQVTEFDVDIDDEELQARYLTDFMTTLFSHRAVAGIVMWGFWEGAHWRPRAALFRRDWRAKPAGTAWQDLVHKQWWTNADGVTDAQGAYVTRGFKGTYQIRASRDALTSTTSVMLTNDPCHVRIRLAAPAAGMCSN